MTGVQTCARPILISQIRVTWQDGTDSIVTRVEPDQEIVILAPPTCAYPDTSGDGVPDFGDFDATDDGVVDIDDLYRASAGQHDANQDGVFDSNDERCVRDYVRVRERTESR